jgi:hypothetical protein
MTQKSVDACAFAVLGAVAIAAAALNATLIFDDGFFAELFRHIANQPMLEKLKVIFFTLDLGGGQYRLYGSSRLLHFILYSAFDTRAWAYAAFIAATQALSAYGLLLIFYRLRIERLPALLMSAAWTLSPFAATSCFHHYSYLILPYQLTIACALVLLQAQDLPRLAWLWRTLAVIIAVLIATTGESHYIATPVILALIVFAAPSARPWRSRVIDVGLPIVTMLATLAAHRATWLALTPPFTGSARYVFQQPTLEQAIERLGWLAKSIPLGMAEQVNAITSPDPRFLIFFMVAIAFPVALAVKALCQGEAPRDRLLLPAAIAAVFLASLGIMMALSAFTGMVSPAFPRRYGYVPNTLAVMTVIAILATLPRRNDTGITVLTAFCAAVLGLWITLEAERLPQIRSEDQRIWSELNDAMKGKDKPAVVFYYAWLPANIASTTVDGFATPGLRGVYSPETLESPLSRFWWQSHYLLAKMDVAFVGDRAVETNGMVHMTGHNSWRGAAFVTPKDNIVVLADFRKSPPGGNISELVRVFPSWDEFQKAKLDPPKEYQPPHNQPPFLEP